jgi:hypothetical protein
MTATRIVLQSRVLISAQPDALARHFTLMPFCSCACRGRLEVRVPLVAAGAGFTTIVSGSARAQVPASAAGDALTVDQAVVLAIKTNRSVRTSELEVYKAEDAIVSVRTRRKPIFQVDVLEARLVSDLNIRFISSRRRAAEYASPSSALRPFRKNCAWRRNRSRNNGPCCATSCRPSSPARRSNRAVRYWR